jgi:hypothetical protein
LPAEEDPLDLRQRIWCWLTRETLGPTLAPGWAAERVSELFLPLFT